MAYQSREFCKAKGCPILKLLKNEKSSDYEKAKNTCKEKCLKTAHEFHQYLKEQGYQIYEKRFIQKLWKLIASYCSLSLLFISQFQADEIKKFKEQLGIED